MMTSCVQPAPEESQPEETAAPAQLEVGVVLDVGGLGDESFNDAAHAGLKRAEEEFQGRIVTKCLEPSDKGDDRKELMRRLAEEGFDLVFGVGFAFTDAVEQLSEAFPDCHFALIDGFVPGLDESSNVICLLFKEHEGSFLVGAAAGLITKTDKVGFVGGMSIPLIEKWEAGYMAGVYYVNPTCEVLSDYVGSTPEAFSNPQRAKELALRQFDAGVDVIYHAAGASGKGVIEAAAERKLLAIGADSDQTLTAEEPQRPYILTSMVKRVDVAVYETIRAFLEGQFRGGYFVLGLAEEGVDYAENPWNETLIGPIKPMLEELKRQIIEGKIVVPVNKEELEQFKASLRRDR